MSTDGDPTPEPPLGAADISGLAAGSTRRAPRLGRFIGVGVLVGLGLAAVIAVLGPSGPVLGRDAIFLLVFLALGTVGALVGAGAAVAADKRSTRGRSHPR